MTDCIGIIGLGLIGGSLAKTVKKKFERVRIVGFDSDGQTLDKAWAAGAVDIAASADLTAFSECGLVFLCANVSAVPPLIEKLSEIVGENCVVTDTGSVKSGVVAFAERFPRLNFVGAHPMAGSERAGFDASTDFLFENAYYIIVSTKNSTERSVSVVKEFIELISAIPIVMNADEHDRVTAVISHVPHLVASALVNLAAKHAEVESMRDLAAGGFKDITRVASSDSKLWQSISVENREEILAAIELFRAEIDEIEGYLRNFDETELGGYLRLAKNFRDNLPASSRAKYVKTYDILADIEDKPGSLAVVVTLLGVNGISVKNIGIESSREYEGGVLRLSFAERGDMEKSVKLLRSMRFNVYEN